MVTNDFLETLRHFTLISVLFSGGNWQIWTMGTFWMSNSREKFIWNSFPLIPPSYVAHSDPATPGTGHIWIACQLQINKQTGEAKIKIQRKKKLLYSPRGKVLKKIVYPESFKDLNWSVKTTKCMPMIFQHFLWNKNRPSYIYRAKKDKWSKPLQLVNRYSGVSKVALVFPQN